MTTHAPLQSLVIASGNAGKLAEIQRLLEGTGLSISSQAEHNVKEVPEDGLSFVENAIIKARNVCQQTGLPALADDSGLAVDHLHGAPGIYSARYSGEGDAGNNLKLLHAMDNVPAEQRGAQFICCMVLMRHAEDPCPIIAEAQWRGQIAEQLSGSEGFGYDPLFYNPELGCTASELSKAEKNRISHRGQALQKLKITLDKLQF